MYEKRISFRFQGDRMFWVFGIIDAVLR